MAYQVRGSMPSAPMPNNGYNYGRIVEGNTRNSYGPWVDPEKNRAPHRFSVVAMSNMRRKKRGYIQGS